MRKDNAFNLDNFSLRNSALKPDSINLSKNEIKTLIIHEIKKIVIDTINSSNDRDESISISNLKDVFQTGLLSRDNSSRRDYKLTNKIRLHFSWTILNLN